MVRQPGRARAGELPRAGEPPRAGEFPRAGERARAGEPPRVGEPARTHALTALRQAIGRGELSPGQRLIEEELAADLGVTRASLRAALLELTTEGLVERTPNKGARVRVVSAEEAVAITECREALEALCAVKAAQRVTDSQIDSLAAIAERLERAVADGDPLTYSDANTELHQAVRVISGQTVAIGLLGKLNAQLIRHQFHLAQHPGRPEQSLGEHLAIIDAITRRDPEAADKATRQHLSSVIAALREAGNTR